MIALSESTCLRCGARLTFEFKGICPACATDELVTYTNPAQSAKHQLEVPFSEHYVDPDDYVDTYPFDDDCDLVTK